jgi:hypothetical protein
MGAGILIYLQNSHQGRARPVGSEMPSARDSTSPGNDVIWIALAQGFATDTGINKKAE